jgi:hypothetical protein
MKFELFFARPWAIVVGSLLASHTLLGATIVAKLGVNRLEPIVITFGATMISDTLSLLGGFSMADRPS